MFKMLRYINWSELSGLLVGAILAVAICLATYILVRKLDQEGVLGNKQYNLYCDLVSGQGLRKGTIVQINGVDIGNVNDISLNDTTGLVRLELALKVRYKDFITNESRIYATRDQNIISERVMNIDISRKGKIVLEDGAFLKSEKAQDIENVLTTANELIARIGELVVGVDTLLKMVIDTNSTIGMLLGSNVLYNRLDGSVLRLNKLLVDADGLMYDVGGLFSTINSGVPKAIAFADTMSTGVMGLMDNLDNLTTRAHGLINSLDTTLVDVSSMVGGLNSVMGTAGNLITDGTQTLNRVDDFVNGASKFWFMRSKIPQKDSIPLLEDKW